jgi:hypothetical protein
LLNADADNFRHCENSYFYNPYLQCGSLYANAIFNAINFATIKGMVTGNKSGILAIGEDDASVCPT